MRLKYIQIKGSLESERLYKSAFKEACSLLVLNDIFASQSSAEQCILRKFRNKKNKLKPSGV